MATIGVFNTYLPIAQTGELKFLIIDLDPVAIRVLKVDLLHFVGPDLRLLAGLSPVTIFDPGSIQVFRKSIHRCYTKSEMYINIMVYILLRPGHHMQLSMLRDLKPNVLPIMKRLFYLFELQHFFI